MVEDVCFQKPSVLLLSISTTKCVCVCSKDPHTKDPEVLFKCPILATPCYARRTCLAYSCSGMQGSPEISKLIKQWMTNLSGWVEETGHNISWGYGLRDLGFRVADFFKKCEATRKWYEGCLVVGIVINLRWAMHKFYFAKIYYIVHLQCEYWFNWKS